MRKTSDIAVLIVAGAERRLAGGYEPRYMAPAAALAFSAPRAVPRTKTSVSASVLRR